MGFPSLPRIKRVRSGYTGIGVRLEVPGMNRMRGIIISGRVSTAQEDNIQISSHLAALPVLRHSLRPTRTMVLQDSTTLV